MDGAVGGLGVSDRLEIKRKTETFKTDSPASPRF